MPHDAGLQRPADASVHRTQLVCRQLPGRPQRVDASVPERLVGVDVPDACDRPLVEDRRLDRRAATGQARRKGLRRESRLERLDPDSLREVGVELLGLEQQPRAEPPDVPVGDVRSVI